LSNLNSDIKEHLQIAGKLFTQKLTLDTRNQEIADNFYPERSDFTRDRDIGDNFADHLFTSYPLVASRELSDQIGAMLRPKSTEWFNMALLDERYEDHSAKEWMQHKTQLMRRAMYDPSAHFQRATKEGDRDYANFGNCVLSVIPNRQRNGLLYRDWHLRDVVWTEDAYGQVDAKYCKRLYTIRQLKQMFGEDKLHETLKQSKDPLHEVHCMHIVIPNDQYGIKSNLKNMSLFVDVDNQHEMESTPLATNYYIVPRWATISDSQYAYSPAMIAGLPDARLFQDMTRVLLEAGEKAVDPPMVAIEEAIRSDISIMAGGITYADADYDERLGNVLRPLNIDRSGIPIGLDQADRTQQMLAKALYLDKFSLPVYNEMTATEAGIRQAEYIRQIMPIFEPMEEEYNAPLCQETFDVMWRMGWMGSVHDVPQSIQQAPDYEFKFISPLSQSEDRKATNQFFAVSEIIQAAATLNPAFVHNVDINKAGRDAIEGTGENQDWLNSPEEVAATQAAEAEQQQMAQAVQLAGQGAESLNQIKELGNAG